MSRHAANAAPLPDPLLGQGEGRKESLTEFLGSDLMELFKQFDPTDLIKRALAEDVGQGDITTAATVAPGAMGRARITVKEPRMILAGGSPH